MSKELKSYLSKKFEGRDSFLENIVFPIFGEENFEDMYDVEALDNGDLRAMAQRTGIKSAIQYGLVQVGTTEINIYDVTVSDRVMMRRNRVGIQQLIRRIMLDYTSAFIIFHYEDSDSWDWRFSFCQKDNKEVTEAKRYTFLLGPGQSCRTAADNFQKLIDKHGDISRDDIVKAFDVEALSKEFFDKYKAQYEKFCNYIYDNRNDESLFGHEFAEWDEKLIRDYVKKLLGRIVFLQFLQKKGWLGVDVNKQWGEGKNQFMRNLFKASSQQQKDNYLDLVLEPLFANALNTQRTNDIFDLNVEGYRTTRIPYLNGGLFERDALDEPKSTFPASYFEELFDFFYQYNFTIDENDPNDAEVGIDPEMLGRIFENLLEDNKDKGAFYTPKEIVQYMCRESLVAYLTTCVMKKQGENHKPEEEIKESVRQLLNKPEDIVPRMTKEHLKNFDSYIRNVKICDPAIGSGAFPMGLLNELVRCRVFINAWAKDENGNLLVGDYAALKTEIISNNIYGVDIEKGAIDIARLRFWLSIIVDEQKPHVLPNFDYKFMQGNSLIPTFDGKYINLETKRTVCKLSEKLVAEKKELYKLKQLHYKASGDNKQLLDIKIKCSILRLIAMRLGAESRAWYDDHSKPVPMAFEGDPTPTSFDTIRKSLPEDMQKTIELADSLYKQLNDESVPVAVRSQIDIHFFDWRIMFTEVFDNGSDGFDIVIGNPPYITMTKNNTDNSILKLYIEKYLSIKKCYSKNIYTLFIELGICNLLTPKGNISYIIPEGLFKTRSYEDCVSMMNNNGDLLFYSTFTNYVFENAVTGSLIFSFRKEKRGATAIHYDFDENYNVKIVEDEDANILDKIFSSCKELKEVAELFKGMVVKDRQEVIFETQNGYPNIFLLGKSISKWSIKKPFYTDYSTLTIVGGTKKKTKHDVFPRIVIRRTGDTLCCAMIDTPALTESTLYSCWSKKTSIDNKYLLGLLNSNLLDFYNKKRNITNQQGFPQILMTDLQGLPIMEVEKDKQLPIVNLVCQILSIKKQNPQADTSALEHEIDQLVYQLYNLTDDEIAIVEGKNE